MKKFILQTAGSIVLLLMAFTWVQPLPAADFRSMKGLDVNELQESIWYLCGRAETSQAGAVISLQGNVYYENIAGRSNFFVLHGDSLMWTGYNIGRRVGVLADTAVYLCRTGNFSTGVQDAQFHATGRMDVTLPLQETGTMSWSVLGHGSAITAPGDTVGNVVLTRHSYHSEAVPADSAAEAVEIVYYRWYAQGSMLPVAVQCGGELFVDEDASERIPEAKGMDDGIDRIARIIDSAVVSFDGDHLTVTLPEPVELHAYIMDVPGNIYASVRGLATEFTLSTADLHPNQYILSLVAEPDAIHVRKILFKI